MAALRIFARSVISTAVKSRNTPNVFEYSSTPFIQLDKRWASFIASPKYSETTKYTDYEVSKDPKEWAYVENILRAEHIPPPPKVIAEDLPSGWIPRKEEAKKLPYYVERSKNHMPSVYLVVRNRGLRRITLIKRIQGDIMLMEAELKQYLKDVLQKDIGTQINEPSGIIKIRGDCVSRVKEWMINKGF